MKKLLPLLALLLVFVVGCQTDSSTNIASGDGGVVLSVSLAPTRVSLGDKMGESYPAYWNEGDRLVVNAEQSNEAIINAENRSKAVFKFSEEATLAYPFNITYPYCATTTAEQAKVEFPAEQNYVVGSFEAGSAPMCGYVANGGEKVVLNHLSTILHFPIISKFEGVVLAKVVITSQNKIAGVFEVDCQSATISATESCEDVVTYLLPANFTLSTTTPSDLFVVLPAVEVGTCEVSFVTTSGEKMTASWTPKAPLSKGIVHEFKTVVYQPKTTVALSPMYGEASELIFSHKKFPDSEEIKIMSFNIRTKTTETDEANNWDNRKEACVELIKDQRPSIIGFQEARYTSQWSYLKERLAYNYEGYGVNRDTGEESGSGEVMGILYDRFVIEMIDCGTFWLSETPNEPSKGFGSNHCRCATWGLFKHISTGVIFYYINTHLDHQSDLAQVEGMKLVAQHLEEYKDTYPLFLTGDFNVSASNVAIDPIEGYMYNAREVPPSSLTDFDATYNGYNVDATHIIDHIYCSNYLRVVEYHTIDEGYGNVRFVSDHYPIYAIVELR